MAAKVAPASTSVPTEVAHAAQSVTEDGADRTDDCPAEQVVTSDSEGHVQRISFADEIIGGSGIARFVCRWGEPPVSRRGEGDLDELTGSSDSDQSAFRVLEMADDKSLW
jgi:hypothetical protein